MNTLTPEGNKLIDDMISSHDESIRAAERERCAAVARKYVERTNADIAHAILREIEHKE